MKLFLFIFAFSVSIERAAMATSGEVQQITITNSEVANRLLEDETRRFVVNAQIVTLNDIIENGMQAACALMNIGPVKNNDTFFLATKSSITSRHFKSTILTFKNKVGFEGFGIRCIQLGFQEVTMDQMMVHFKGIIEFK